MLDAQYYLQYAFRANITWIVVKIRITGRGWAFVARLDAKSGAPPFAVRSIVSSHVHEEA